MCFSFSQSDEYAWDLKVKVRWRLNFFCISAGKDINGVIIFPSLPAPQGGFNKWLIV